MKYTYFTSWFAVLFLNFFTISAYATCNPGGGNTWPSSSEDYYIYRAFITSGGIMPNPNSVVVGRQIGKINMRMSAGITGTAGYVCVPYGPALSRETHPSFAPPTPPPGPHPTRVPGIGFLSMTIHNASFPASTTVSPLGKPGIIEAEIIFVRTGDIQTSQIADLFSGIFAHEVVRDTGQILFEYRFNDNLNVTPPPPVKPTCNLEPIPPVSLGTHPISIFTGSNKVTPLQDFTLELSCSGGDPGTSISAKMTLTDNNNTGNTTDALSLSTTNVTGVSVQILRNGSPLNFGPQSSSNSHDLGTITTPSGGGAFSHSIPLQARYKQTGNSVSGGGDANAEATVTINYQ